MNIIKIFSIFLLMVSSNSLHAGWITDNISFKTKIESPACPDGASGTALVVIDMQPFFVTRGKVHDNLTNKEKVEKLIAKQLEAINVAMQARIPIIFIEYYDVNSNTNEILKDAIKNYNQAHFIQKDADGMLDAKNPFREDLIDFLKYSKIKTLIITGANGNACVKRSIIGALNNNCNVVAYSEGIADFNYDEFIYPYAGYKKTIDLYCKSCSLTEISNIDEIAEIINSNQ